MEKGKPFSTWISGAPKSKWAMGHYSDTTKVTTNVGLKNDQVWLPVYGLFSDELPYLCKTQVKVNFRFGISTSEPSVN